MTTEHAPSTSDFIRVQGNKQYLPVPSRVQWMRGDHPDWGIDTAVVELNWTEGYAVMRAEVRDEHGRLIGAGTKTETRKGFGDFVEKAETGAVGRALARAGYGTEDALDLDGDRFADAPIEQPQGGERDRSTGKRSPATTRPAVQRSPEEQALADELLALTSDRHEYRSQLADEVGVPKGERANADQLREMIALAIGHAAGIEPAVGAITAGDQTEPEVQSPQPPSGSVPPSTEEAIARARRKAAATQKAEQEALPLGAES